MMCDFAPKDGRLVKPVNWLNSPRFGKWFHQFGVSRTRPHDEPYRSEENFGRRLGSFVHSTLENDRTDRLAQVEIFGHNFPSKGRHGLV